MGSVLAYDILTSMQSCLSPSPVSHSSPSPSPPPPTATSGVGPGSSGLNPASYHTGDVQTKITPKPGGRVKRSAQTVRRMEMTAIISCVPQCVHITYMYVVFHLFHDIIAM